MKTEQQKHFEANKKSLADLKAIAATGVKVLIPGHTGLIKVTEDLSEDTDVMGYAFIDQNIDGSAQTFAAYYK